MIRTKGGYAMSQHKVVELKKQAQIEKDSLTDLLRTGARRLLYEAVQVELGDFMLEFAALMTEDGRQAVVRNGYLPEREILTGIGPIRVRVPKVRDRSGSGIKFNSKLLPPYLRRSKSLEETLPWLYLKGISTGDFSEALQSLVGDGAKGLSAPTISRLKATWEAEHEAWSKRDLSKKRYVYFWADGIYFNVRLEESRQCILIIVGVTEYGKKEFVAIEDGYRESEQSWREVLLGLKHRGLEIGPALAVGDGALGFWGALSRIYPQTRHQRCWVHKKVNVLNKVPKGMQPKIKAALQEIWMAETREDAHKAFDLFVETYEAKYPKAVECLTKDREELLTFYDFPAEHWQHIRTTNPIESTFATVRLRTAKTRGCVSRKTILAMVFKLGQSAQKRWHKIRGFKLLGEVIQGVKFVDGKKADKPQESEVTDDHNRVAA
jgi:putative transposase